MKYAVDFIAFEILYPLTQPKQKRNIIGTVVMTFLMSLCIELLQPLISGIRSSDITDLITNTTGGCNRLLYLLSYKAGKYTYFEDNKRKRVIWKTPSICIQRLF